MLPKNRVCHKLKKTVLFFVIFTVLASGVFAQSRFSFPAGDFWSLNMGLGMSNFLVAGSPFEMVIDPKLWLSPALMTGSRVGINYSREHDEHDIFTIEGQVYMRWNFLRLGRTPERTSNLFVQGGLGMIAAYRGSNHPFDDVRRTRGSVLADAAVGVTVPLTNRWNIEPSVRFGYPHIWGFTLTAGYKFPLPRVTIMQMAPTRVELVEMINTLPVTTVVEVIRELPVEVVRELPVEVIRMVPNELVARTIIPAIEFIIFGPDIGSYNVGIDADARQLNELVLNATAQMLKDDPGLRVRIEGHANPYTINHSEHEELMLLSAMRANAVADLLIEKGVKDEQIIIISMGGTRNATNEWDLRNRNRRVELMIIQFDSN